MQPNGSSKATVVLIEDHRMFREQLAQMINSQEDMRVCGQADDSRSGMELIRGLLPELAIVDITLKGASGLELLKDVCSEELRVATLVLSMHDEALYAERALRAGARGYITKHEASTMMLTAIRTVLAGEVYLQRRFMSEFVNKAVTVGVRPSGQDVERLTDRELEVFDLIGRGTTAREISHQLGIGLTTVDTYRARIKDKLNIKNAARLHIRAAEWVQRRDGRGI